MIVQYHVKNLADLQASIQVILDEASEEAGRPVRPDEITVVAGDWNFVEFWAKSDEVTHELSVEF